jgi:hypothetical protein
MATNTWINVTADPAIAKKPDRADHRNTVVGGTADGANLTVAWDSAVVTTLTQWDSCVAAARLRAAGSLSP